MEFSKNMTHAKPWLAEYPADVSAEIDVNAYPSLVALLEDSFRRFADRDMASFMGAGISYRAVDEASVALAAWLQSKGLAKGARVALMMPNVPQYCVAIAAVLRAGYVVVNVNPLYTPRELEHQLKDSGAEAIIILENFVTTLQEVIDHTPIKHVVIAAMGDSLSLLKGALVNFVVRRVKKMVPAYDLPAKTGRTVLNYKAVIDAGRKLKLTRPAVGPDDVAFLQYTGGTTGVSKGATLLHRNVVANILQCEAWFSPVLKRLGEKQLTTVCALPLYHIFALTACYLLATRLGGRNILIANPRDIPGFIKLLQGEKVNIFPAVNTLYNGLVHHPDFAKLDFSELIVSNGGGMAVQQATAEAWLKVTGCPIAEGYGLSETSPVATVNRLDIHHFTGTIGLPIPNTEIAIRDDDGHNLPLGDAGEICIRGPQVMAGYWQRPDETAKVMTPDGFFRTGDVGVMDDQGYVKIVDRKKDMVLVSGFNVYPNEVEQVVNMCPGVLECAVIGVPDEHSGEAVKVFVVKKDASLTAEAVSEFCKHNLTGYKRPKHIEFRADLPKTNVGKVLRRQLRPDAAK